MPKINIYYNKPSDLERRGIEERSTLNYIAQNTAISFVRSAFYNELLENVEDDLSNESQLSLEGQKSTMQGGAKKLVENILVLSTEDKSIQVVFFDCKIRVRQQNTIIETALTGKRGTVKEYIQGKDYEIDVSGNIINETELKGFPLEELRLLIDILELPETFEVANVLLRDGYGIDKVVVKSCEIKQDEAKYRNILPYSLNLVSDEDYELDIE